MDSWREWIKTITALVILVGFLQMLLPDDSLKSVARLVIGLVLMLAILQPILALLYWDFDTTYPLVRIEETVPAVDWQARAKHLQQAGAAALVPKVTEVSRQQIEGLALVIAGVRDASASISLTKDGQLGTVELLIKPEEPARSGLASQVQRVIVHYYNLDPDDVVVSIDSNGD